MYYTYILKSLKTGTYYYGYTSDLFTRLNQHNEGLVRSTKSKRNWIIHYFEEFNSKSDAIKRELFFKSIAGYNWLRDEGIIMKAIAVPSGKIGVTNFEWTEKLSPGALTLQYGKTKYTLQPRI